jgi:hypothetical protein
MGVTRLQSQICRARIIIIIIISSHPFVWYRTGRCKRNEIAITGCDFTGATRVESYIISVWHCDCCGLVFLPEGGVGVFLEGGLRERCPIQVVQI